jgi:hypothetical protein
MGLRDWTTDMGPEIEGVQRTLSKAVADERIRAWGRVQDDDGHAHGPLEPIPGDLFKLTSNTWDVVGARLNSMLMR